MKNVTTTNSTIQLTDTYCAALLNHCFYNYYISEAPKKWQEEVISYFENFDLDIALEIINELIEDIGFEIEDMCNWSENSIITFYYNVMAYNINNLPLIHYPNGEIEVIDLEEENAE
jgi:hypothetical protein